VPAPNIPPDEVEAALAARRELGPELEPAIVEAFPERIEKAIDARVDERIAAGLPAKRAPREDPLTGRALVLALGSIGMGIGATGASAGIGGVSGAFVAIVVWLAIAAVNVAYAFRR
jgi:hypothetical protein